MPAYAIVSNYAGKVIDHAAYAAKVRTMSDAELLYTIHDCQASLLAWPDCPSAGYYTDEIHYAAGELYRRRKGCQRDTRPVSDCGGFRLADDHDPDAIVLEPIAAAIDAITPEYVASQYANAGQPMADDERAALDGMTEDDLTDQLAYLCDYQG
jgi:hypothetical protein